MLRFLQRFGIVPVVALVAAMSIVTGTAAGPTSAAAVANGFTTFPVTAAATPVQLLTGTDGRLWFLTAQSRLGLISSSGQVTLLPVTVPHPNGPPVLVGAGPEGVWAYSSAYGFTSYGCTISLSNASQVVISVAIAHPANPVCNGGARDGARNGWFAVHGGPQLTGVSRMVMLAPTGHVRAILPDRGGARPKQVALGSDGAIWALEFNGHSFGRYTANGPATTVALSGSETPPYPGSMFFGIGPRQLLARSDGTFWVYGGNVGLSDPAGWFVRYLYRGAAGSTPTVATTPDGALWSVASDRTGPAERMVRLDATGRFDRSATLPTGVTGAAMATTGPFAATQDGSTWTVTTDGTNKYLLRYHPTALTHVAIWTGAAGTGRWSTAANWQGDTPPASGDAVELPTASTMVDDLPGLTLQELLLSGPAHLSGAPLSFGVGGVQVKSKVQASVANPIVIKGGAVQIIADPLGTLILSGAISGSGGLNVGGEGRAEGTVVLSAANTYAGGTTVVGGTLEIDGNQPSSPVTVGEAYFEAAAITGRGTTGSVTVNSGGTLVPQVFNLQGCPTTLSIHGNLVLAANSAFQPWIAGCGTPLRQTATRVKVTGTVSIDPQSFFFLATVKDTTQLACLISSQGPMSGSFGGAAEGSTSQDYGADQGDVVRFSYHTPGGPGCYAHSFTAQTGIDP